MSLFPNTKPPIGRFPSWTHPSSKGMIGEFLFNETDGDILKNQANYISDYADIVSCTWDSEGLNIPYRYGYANCGYIPEMEATQDKTAIMWVTTNSYDSINFCMSMSNSTTGWAWGILGPLGSSFGVPNNVVFFFNMSSVLSSGYIMSNNTPTMLAFTQKGNTIYLYVNGLLKNSGTLSFTDVGTGTVDLFIGSRSEAPDSGAELGWDGIVNYAAYFNRNLSDYEILNYYVNTYAKYSAGANIFSSSVAGAIGNVGALLNGGLIGGGKLFQC